jgi:plasmid stability protein
VILMVGSRMASEELLYPVSEVAARHGASVEREARDAREAYSGTPPPRPARVAARW